MNIYKLGDQTIVIIDGEPYLKLEQHQVAVEMPPTVRHYRKKKKSLVEPSVEPKPSKSKISKKQPVSDEIKDEIRQKFKQHVADPGHECLCGEFRCTRNVRQGLGH